MKWTVAGEVEMDGGLVLRRVLVVQITEHATVITLRQFMEAAAAVFSFKKFRIRIHSFEWTNIGMYKDVIYCVLIS